LFNNDEGEIGHALGLQKQTVADLSPNFKMVLKEVKRTETAEINQDFFDKLYGKDVVSSEAEMREKIKAELSAYFDQQAQHLLEHELFDTLVAKHNIELPDAFLKRWLLDRYTDKFTAENIDEAFIPEANYLRNHILEEKILIENNIKVEEDEIKTAAINYTKQMFGAYGNQGLSDDLIMSIVEPQLQKEDFRSRMINMAVREKVNSFILNAITIDTKEVSSEEFFQIMESHNKKHHNHAHDEAHDAEEVDTF
jgi:trigger factor